MTHPLPAADALVALGFSPHFAAQLDPASPLFPARVAEVRRDRLHVLPGPIPLHAPDGAGTYAVGDWVLHDGQAARARLRPTTEIVRKAAFEDRRQLVAANVDTLGIVTSCNADFSAARLERYLAVALQAGCAPLVILTKADMADPEPYLAQARALSPLVTAVALVATDAGDARRLDPWCGPGLTLALAGSSGVGKTTLLNALAGLSEATQGIREDDAKGRHTTTARFLRPALAGGWLIDTPGVRELGLLDAADGVSQVFADLEALAATCRFRDCAHGGEPGCAIRAAIADGALDPDRLARWGKLAREDALNTETALQRGERRQTWKRRAREGAARGDWKRRGPD